MHSMTKRLIGWGLLVATILMIPLMLNFPWTGSDFVFGAVLLFCSALTFELVTKKMESYNHKLVAGFVVLAILAFVWVFAATGFEGLERYF